MAEQKNKEVPITIAVGDETYGFAVPGHAEIKFYYDTGATSLYEASRNLVVACAIDKAKIKRLADDKPAVVPQLAAHLLRIAGTGMEVRLENFPKPDDAS